MKCGTDLFLSFASDGSPNAYIKGVTYIKVKGVSPAY